METRAGMSDTSAADDRMRRLIARPFILSILPCKSSGSCSAKPGHLPDSGVSLGQSATAALFARATLESNVPLRGEEVTTGPAAYTSQARRSHGVFL